MLSLAILIFVASRSSAGRSYRSYDGNRISSLPETFKGGKGKDFRCYRSGGAAMEDQQRNTYKNANSSEAKLEEIRKTNDCA